MRFRDLCKTSPLEGPLFYTLRLLMTIAIFPFWVFGNVSLREICLFFRGFKQMEDPGIEKETELA